MQISHGCLTSELQKYPILKRRMGESVSNFLRDGLRPAETMITHIIEMEVSVYIPSSYVPIGGNHWISPIVKFNFRGVYYPQYPATKVTNH